MVKPDHSMLKQRRMTVIVRIIALIMTVSALFSGLIKLPGETQADVVFDPQNGSEKITASALPGEKLTAPEPPQKRGCRFTGWYSDGKKWDFDKDVFAEPLTLSARYSFTSSFFEPDENAAERAEGATLRVMSFNMLCCDYDNKPPVEGRDAAAFETILRYLPDVIGIQEIGAEWYDAFEKRLPEYKIVTLGEKAADGKSVYSTVAYRADTVEVIRHGTQPLKKGDEHIRCLTWALFKDKATGTRFTVTSTHWSLTQEKREEQAVKCAAATRALGLFFRAPVISTGDFNANDGTVEINKFLQASRLADTKLAAKSRGLACNTYHLGDGTGSSDDHSSGYYALGRASFRTGKINTGLSIDHIFVSPDIATLYYDTVADSVSLEASDHCPIFADLAL